MFKKIEYLFLGLILLAGLLVRIYKIDNPIADWHSWRQADTAAVTRNFVKFGIDILHPRYDDFSDVSGKGLFNPQGYRYVEFPLFNLIHYSLLSIGPFLTLEVWGRLTSVLSSLVSAVFLFFIVRRRLGSRTALLTSFFYILLPFNIYFTRVVLPDPLMVTLFLAALNFHDLKRRYLTLLFGSLAILVKPVAIFFLLPIYIKNFWLGLFMLAPFGLWRLWSHNFPEGVPSSLWLLNGNRIRFRPAFFRWIFGERLGDLILGHWGVLPLTMGLLDPKFFATWVVGAALYLFTFATGNVHHDYYQIPIIPIISILLAIGCVNFSTTYVRKIMVATCVIFMFGFSWYDIKGLYQINNWSIVHAGLAVDKLVPKDAVIIAPYGGDTALLYQTNRHGFPYMYLPIKDFIDRFGATYYVSVNYDDDTNKIMAKYTVIAQTPEYVIVKLVEPPRL